MFRRLLISTNLADGLQRLVNFVPSLAAANIEHITFLHCVPLNESGAIPRIDTGKVEHAKAILAVAKTHAVDGITIEVIVESGRPTDLILKVAKDQKADLLMVSYSLRNDLSEKLFGSTTIDLYNRTPIPLLSVRPQLISTYTAEELDLRCRHLFRHFMLPYDDTEAAKYLVEQVKQRVQHQSHSVLEACHLLWVIDDCDRRDIPRAPFIQEAQTKLAQVKAELAALKLQVVAEVKSGTPVLEVIAASLEPDVSAIAVCHNPRTTFFQKSVPSFAQSLLKHSWHPVLYFPLVRA
jgi:nucleotide-binding universal stress UspA family protein